MIAIMERIVILGCAGSGKTTLAQKLGQRIGGPVICLDDIWQPLWDEKDVPAFRNLIDRTHGGTSWISDGNFALATFDIRLGRATQVIWLECSRLVCCWRALKRVFRRGEAHRIADLSKVLKFIWRFDRVNRPRIESARLLHGSDVAVRRLRGTREVAEFLRCCGEGPRYSMYSAAVSLGPEKAWTTKGAK